MKANDGDTAGFKHHNGILFDFDSVGAGALGYFSPEICTLGTPLHL